MENQIMKFNLIKRATTLFAMAAAAIFALGFTTVTAAPSQGKATVVNVKGEAQYSTGGAWQPLKSGMTLMSGSVIQTAEGAEVDLDMGPSGVLKVEPSSTVSIDKLTVEKTSADTITETQLDVRKGKIAGKTKGSLSSASRYEIKTPTGVAGIRGTVFSVGADGTISCSSGGPVMTAVFVGTPPQLVTVEIKAGQKLLPGSTTPVAMSQAESAALESAAGKILVGRGQTALVPGGAYFTRPGNPTVFVDPLTSQASTTPPPPPPPQDNE
jgi:hypothetical protein